MRVQSHGCRIRPLVAVRAWRERSVDSGWPGPPGPAPDAAGRDYKIVRQRSKACCYLGKIAEALEREHFGLERAMKALVLAAALRMIGPAVQNTGRRASTATPSANRVQRDARKNRPRARHCRRSEQHRAGRSGGMSAPIGSQYGVGLLIGASFKTQRITRMVIQHRQQGWHRLPLASGQPTS